LPDWKREIVTTLFIADSKIAAGHAPFRTVRQDAAAPGAILREQMRQLVPERAIDFRRVVFAQARIQRNEFLSKDCPARATSQARIPFHAHQRGNWFRAHRTQKLARLNFQRSIASKTKL
jgi:hypothetical protein